MVPHVDHVPNLWSGVLLFGVDLASCEHDTP